MTNTAPVGPLYPMKINDAPRRVGEKFRYDEVIAGGKAPSVALEPLKGWQRRTKLNQLWSAGTGTRRTRRPRAILTYLACVLQ